MAKTIQVQLQEATQANAELNTKMAELSADKVRFEFELQSKVAALEGEVAKLNADVTAHLATISELTTKVTALEATEKDLATRAAAQATQIVAAAGHRAPIALSSDAVNESKFEQYKSEKDPVKRSAMLLANFDLFANNPEKLK